MRKNILLGLVLSFSSICYSQSIFEIGANDQISVSQIYQFLPTDFANAKAQFMITNSELIEAGIPVGATIIGLEWYVVTDNTPATSYYDLYITDDYTGSSMPAGGEFAAITPIQVGSGLSDAGTYSGWHRATFTNAHIWDGTDNIVLQLCRTGGNQSGDDYIAIFNGSMDLMVSGYNSICSAPVGYYTNTQRPFLRIITLCTNSSSSITETACDSYTSPSGNYVWTSSDTYMDTIPNAAGCDSIITVNLTINNSTGSTITETACDSYTSPSGNYVWTSSDTYMDTIPNAAGCDSIITVNLTINNSTGSTITETACDSYTSPSGNYVWTSSDTYMDTIPNAAGCDSIITVNLTINNSTGSTITETACDSYTSPSGNYVWTSSDTYMDTIPNAAGCDSIITVNLTINTVNSSVTQSGSLLTADESGAIYQWLDCLDMTPISEAVNQSYTALANGDYAVSVTKNGCSDTSTCYTVTGVGILGNGIETELHLYPNPTGGSFIIDMGETYSEVKITITDLNGKLVLSKTFNEGQLLNLNLEEPAGVYFLKTDTGDKKALIRLIKE